MAHADDLLLVVVSEVRIGPVGAQEPVEQLGVLVVGRERPGAGPARATLTDEVAPEQVEREEVGRLRAQEERLEQRLLLAARLHTNG